MDAVSSEDISQRSGSGCGILAPLSIVLQVGGSPVEFRLFWGDPWRKGETEGAKALTTEGFFTGGPGMPWFLAFSNPPGLLSASAIQPPSGRIAGGRERGKNHPPCRG